MENAKIKNMYDLSQSIAGEYLSQFTYPWEALKGISDFIKKLGPTLDPEIYEKRGENIWVAKSATVAPTACLNGPLIIDEDAEIRHCAFIRGSAIIGKGSVVGNSTEIKMISFLTRYRYHITITSGIPFSVTTSHMEPVQLPPM
mgnify:FL=1